MKSTWVLVFTLIGIIFSGCVSQPVADRTTMSTTDYAAREPIETRFLRNADCYTNESKVQALHFVDSNATKKLRFYRAS